MKQIVFATGNPGKLRYIRDFAARYGYEILSPDQAGLEFIDVEETGATYEENARLKVQAYLDQPAAKRLIICGDDTGVEIPALNNEPGIHTRRWLGYRMSDDEIVGYMLGRLYGTKDRMATLRATVAYSINGGAIRVISGKMSGMITEVPISDAPREEGVPMHRICIVHTEIPLGKFHTMSVEERGGLLSHREAAFKQMFETLDEPIASAN